MIQTFYRNQITVLRFSLQKKEFMSNQLKEQQVSSFFQNTPHSYKTCRSGLQFGLVFQLIVSLVLIITFCSEALPPPCPCGQQESSL